MANDLLLEIGTEELPASFVAKALEAMPELCTKLFEGARIEHGTMKAIGTPRRLTLIVEGVADAQRDISEEVLGPPKSVAFDAEGKPTKAGEGFAKKLGKGAADLRLVSTPKGEYAAVRRDEKGVRSAEVLPELLARLCATIPFQKSMRWGVGDYSFGRPVHWIVALHGESIIPVEFAGVKSGRTSRGHRFLSPANADIASVSQYTDTLRKVHVLADPAERRASMYKRLLEAAQMANAELIEDDFLMDECLSLVEEPHVVLGGFEESYLTLPEEVIVASMRGHQRYFALREPKTKRLLPLYLNVVNTANDPQTIRIGNDRVLRARLADARFFVEEDRKVSLSTRAEKLAGVVFQAKLGTVAEKASRIRTVAEALAKRANARADLALIGDAAALAKADLVSLIVGEFPELQGLMGRYYAIAEGRDARVADAIRDHYLPKGAYDVVPSDALAAFIGTADRADTLIGCFGVGLVPSGSADPFALRRAALAIVRIALEGPCDIHVLATIDDAYNAYAAMDKKLAPLSDIRPKLDEFFRARLKAFYADKYAGDGVDACLAAWDGGSLRDLDARMKALAAFRTRPEFEALAIAFKRSYNIAKDAPAGDVDPKLLQDEAEKILAETFRRNRPAIEAHTKKGEYEAALSIVAKELRGPIDRFFETVFVMVDDTNVRDNRLRLLASIANTITQIAHFHVLTTQQTP
ncbi:MAG: glycine--tRNA ligase subunit beta [Sandaracinaceae bacterium]|nr:glycine--tRNA ligase subunit beta [Sandaracinaceae bacterium]